MNEYKQTLGVNNCSTGKLKNVAIEGIAKIGDNGGYHNEEGNIGCKLGSFKKEIDVMLLEDYGMKGISLWESVVSKMHPLLLCMSDARSFV
jgi:hypothetical protein